MKVKISIVLAVAMMLLAGCNPYRVETDLSADEVRELKAQVKTLQQQIDDYVQETPDDATIAWVELIELSRTYEQLGELGKAIIVYEDVLADGEKTKAILNNLGKLYEKTEQYDKAVVMYQRINDEYFDHDYLYDITWAYIRAGDRKNAEKYFNAWQLEMNKTDNQTQQAIKKLRDAEKGDESS